MALPRALMVDDPRHHQRRRVNVTDIDRNGRRRREWVDRDELPRDRLLLHVEVKGLTRPIPVSRRH
jgi:CBS-domain-containing membrane protein